MRSIICQLLNVNRPRKAPGIPVPRKPMQRESARKLTPQLRKEALREAREWGETRGDYCRGLGSWSA